MNNAKEPLPNYFKEANRCWIQLSTVDKIPSRSHGALLAVVRERGSLWDRVSYDLVIGAATLHVDCDDDD